MRILYITDQIYLHGGAEKILIQKLNYWAEVYQYDVLLVTTQQDGKPSFFELSPKVKHHDLGVKNHGKSQVHPKNLFQIFGYVKELKSVIHTFNPDAIFLISLSLIRYFLPFIARKYAIFNEYHTSYYGFYLGYQKLSPLQKIKKQILYRVIRFMESFYTKIVFLNHREFEHYKGKNAIVIPNFYDEIKEIPQVEKKNQVIALGRLSNVKGYDILIDAWEMIGEKAPGWTLEIYGNGENHAKLTQQIENKNLSHTVHLNPATDKVNEKLSESAFYAMSSHSETFPMVLLEAMLNGLPTVSFDVPTGPASILTDGEDSILVKADDVKTFAEKMLLLIQDEALRISMGKQAKNNVERFNPKLVMGLWHNLITANKK